jgi:PIN domain nuclease of toxin-antitoxin system
VTRVLLDTHALLWYVYDDERLSSAAAAAIADPGSEKLLGVGSLWEIVIKSQLGKLRLGMPVEKFFAEHVHGRCLELVPVEPLHLLVYANLPLLHRDPFDRLLVAQARTLGVAVVTGDPRFAPYGVDVIW